MPKKKIKKIPFKEIVKMTGELHDADKRMMAVHSFDKYLQDTDEPDYFSNSQK